MNLPCLERYVYFHCLCFLANGCSSNLLFIFTIDTNIQLCFLLTVASLPESSQSTAKRRRNGDQQDSASGARTKARKTGDSFSTSKFYPTEESTATGKSKFQCY